MFTLMPRAFHWMLLCGLLSTPALISAAASLSLPGQPVAREKRVFDEIDVDKDGRVTEAEFVSYELRRRFEAADVNKDGRLSKDEYVSALKNEVGEKQANAEWKLINGGKTSITLDEFLQNDGAAREASAEFKKLDRSSHGYVTMNEWTKGKHSRKRAGAGR